MFVRSSSNYMRKLLYIIIATILLAACAGNGRERAALDAAQAIIYDRPDSALAILKDVDYNSLVEEYKARFGLLFTSAMYRCSRKMDNDTLIDRSISFFQQNGNMTDLANSYYYKGCANYVRGEMKESIFNLKKAEYLISNCDEEFANKLYERLVYANYRSGCKELALGYAKRFLDSSVELADSKLIVCSLSTVASCYYQQGQKDSAQFAFSQCMPVLHTIGKNLHASILSNLAKLCYDAGDYRQAVMYADSALWTGSNT